MNDPRQGAGDCINRLTNIEELGTDRRLLQGWVDQWPRCDWDNRMVAKLGDYAGRGIPKERALQCGMLD